MLESLAIKAALGKAWSFLGKVPNEVWYALGALIIWWFASAHYIGQGREEVLTELRKQEAIAEQKAMEARASADADARERATEEQEKADTLTEVIENAENTGSNALDDMFSLWPSD